MYLGALVFMGFASSLGFCIYSLPLRVYESLSMETNVTFVSWRRVTDLLSNSEPSQHSFLSSFIYLGAAQSQPCLSVGKRAYRVHLALTRLEMSCFSPG